MVLSLLSKRNVSHGKVKGKELTLGSWRGFLCELSLLCFSEHSTGLMCLQEVSHRSWSFSWELPEGH